MYEKATNMKCHIELSKGSLLWLSEGASSPYGHEYGNFEDIKAPELRQWLTVADCDYHAKGFKKEEIAEHIAEHLRAVLPHLPKYSEDPVIALPSKFATDLGLQTRVVTISEFIDRKQ